ncbi:MAG: anthranilate phosphoribosyltransferase [Planctomycetales bacterium]
MPSDPLRTALDRLLAGRDLSAAEMQAAVAGIMDGGADEVRMAAFLTALRIKGETVEELAGAASAMIERAAPVRSARTGLLDTCGTGGDGLRTFNISTATALVAAAAGVPVAKHGNRSVSSSSGSADVLEALGVDLRLTPAQVGACLDEVGIGFCFAPLVHGAMKHAAPVRQRLGFRTVFNLLGPLTNPAGAEFQLVGAHRVETAEKLAHALAALGRARATVVCGDDALDEVALWGETCVFRVRPGDVRREAWTAASFGLPECSVEELRVDSAEESAGMIRELLAGGRGAARDIVVANTAAALWTAERAADLVAATAQAAAALDTGRARELLARLADWTRRAGDAEALP